MNRWAKEALLPDELRAAQELLTKEFGLTWRPCTTVIFLESHPAHHLMPPWLNPYDKRIIEDHPRRGRMPRTMYEQRLQSLARQYGKEEAQRLLLKDIRSFLTGFDDVKGNHWCGQCFAQYQLINLGEELAYPALWWSRTEAGYDHWLHLARFGGGAGVADALRLAKSIAVRAH